MSSFDPNFVSSIAGKIIDMIKDSDDEYFPKVQFIVKNMKNKIY
jgi:hypothetical protein